MAGISGASPPANALDQRLNYGVAPFCTFIVDGYATSRYHSPDFPGSNPPLKILGNLLCAE